MVLNYLMEGLSMPTKSASAPRKVVRKPASKAKAVPVPDAAEPEGVATSGDASVALATIPPMSVAKSYIHRSFSGHKDFDIFDYCRKNKRSLLIEGPTGPGKTMATRAWAATNKRMVARIPCNVGVEPSQLFGKYVPADGGGFKWVDGPVTHVVRHGGVLLINEINFMPDRVSTVFFGLLDGNREIVLLDHEGEVIKAHDDLLIVADMNPDYEGTRPLNKAFRNRFGLQLVWDYDDAVEKKLVSSANLLNLAKLIRSRAAAGEFDTPVSTNMLMEFEEIALSMGVSFAFSNFVNHFNSDERAAVRLVCDTLSADIESDLVAPTGDDEDWGTEDDGPTEGERPTDYDPEWGIYGKDWVYEDESL